MMKKILLFALEALMVLTWCGAEAQENACSDTIYWGSRLSFLESECCWTVPEGSNWGLIAYSDGIAISNPDSADHWIYSPWIEIPATAAADSVMLCFNTSAPCNADYSLCVTTDGTTWDTLYRGFAHNSHPKIYMGDYAGQMVRLGFCHYGYVNSNWQGSDSTCSGSLDQQLRVCCITLRSIMPPVVTLAATDEAFVGTPKNFKVIFTEGTRQGLSCMWHSTLMDSTITLNADFLTLNYTRSGVDTLTVAVTNNYGSDTAQAVVTVYDCSPVSTLPWKARMKDFKCWRSVGDRGFDIVNDSELKTQYDGRNCTLGIATQGITLPNDTAMLTLHWKAKRENGEVYPQAMYLLVSTEESDSLASYDTIFFTTSSSYNDYTGYTADLSSYGGRTVYMAFLVKRNYGLAMVHIKDIEVIYERMPMVTLSAPSTARVGGSIVFTASLEQGDTLDANMACHSSLLDSTWVSGYSEDFTLVYPAAGVDTVTVTVSNPYGSSTSSRVVHIFQCDTIAAFPWVEEFVSMGNEASYNTCWEINGWRHLANNHFFGHRNDLMESNTTGNYMVMPPIRVPETGAERLKVWVNYAKKMLVTVSTDGGQTYPDTVYFDNDDVFNWWLRTVPLAPYAGQTVHVRLASTVSSSFIDRVVVDYETSPCVALIVPERIATDVPTLCVATLRYGDTAGLVYTWHSQVGGTFTTNATGDSAWVTYSTGITGFYDTISVIATNSFGADTVCHPLQVIDCAPATTLPWTETFADGIYCWYKPYGSKFIDAIPDNYYILEYLRHLYLNVQNDTLGSWIMSKAVEIPADTTLGVTLFWKVASSDNNYHHLYSVLVTTSNDYTDTANYTVLYTDSSTHINFSNYDTRSVSLAQYAGQTIHVAIHNHGNHLAPSGIGLYFDNVEIRASQMPVVRVTADATTYYYGDTARFTATLLEGIANGITYTWHSALMDTTFTGGNTWSLGYGLANGRDTVIVIATNVYGSDTASVIVNSTIITQPVVSFGHNGVFLTDTTVFTAHILNHCVDDSMTYTWHSSLMDTTFTSHISTFTLLYTLGGTDTVTLIVDNHYATDTATMVLNLIDCRPKPLPWNEDFEGVIATAANVVGDLPVCWDYSWNGTNVAYAPHVITPTGYQYITDLPSNALFLVVGGYTGYDNTATVTLPHFADSLQHLSIAFDYRFETAALGTLTVGYCDSNGLFTAVKTLPGHAGSYLRDTISLYAATLSDAQIALRWEYGSLWYAVAIDNIVVFNDPLPIAPQVALSAPFETTLGDTVTISTTLNDCSRNALTLTLHSTLLDTTIHPDNFQFSIFNFQFAYSLSGVDTLTCIASNAYGADTAVFIVRILDCGNVTVPYDRDFEDVTTGQLPLCWNRTWNGTNATYEPHVISTDGYNFFGTLPSKALLMLAGNSSGYGNQAEAILPHFSDSLQHLALAFDYRFEKDSRGALSVGYYDTNDNFVAVKILQPRTGSYRRDTAVFTSATLPDAQMVLRWTCAIEYYAVAIDNIAVFNADSLPMAPLVAIDGPTTAEPYDTVIFTAQLLRGDTTDLTYTWHSTLLGRVMAGPSIRLLYETIGVDTLSVIATTAIGVNAAMLIVTIDTLSVPDTLWRTITLLCDSTMGTVSGAGVYPDSNVVTIKAVPFEGYHFVAWNDNDTRTVRTITLVSDTAFTAYFAADTLPTPPPDTLWRTVAVTANVDGVCETYGSGTYADSSRVEMGYMMVDTVNEGGRWQFLGWSDGENDNPRTILVTSDTVIVALFEWMADSVGINELRDNSYEIRVYPNPAHGAVTVSVGAPATLTVLDLTGRVVVAPLSLSSSATLPLTDLPSGTYFLRVTTEEGTAVKRLIVK